MASSPALPAATPAGQPKPPRPPIQPPFKWNPYGRGALLLPTLGILFAFIPVILLDEAATSWRVGSIFFAVLGFGTGWLLDRAMRTGLAATVRGVFAGAAGAWIFAEQGMATAFFLITIVFIAFRLTQRFSLSIILFVVVAAVAGVIGFGAIDAILQGAFARMIGQPVSVFATGTIACYAFVCATTASGLPAGPGFPGFMDALLTGLRAALYGLAVSVPTCFMILHFALPAASSAGIPAEPVVAIAIAIAMGLGHFVSMFELFYTARFVEDDEITGAIP